MASSRIGRPIDPRYPTNVAIVAISAVVFVAAAGYTYLQGALDLGWAGTTAVAGFMAWAIARELDPDHPYSAFVATAVVLGVSAITSPSLLLSFWILLTLRIVGQTPGTPTMVDGIITIGLALWASWQGFWIAAPLTALAFIADARLPNPTTRLKLAPIPLLGLALAWPIQFEWEPSWIHLTLLFTIPLLMWGRIQGVCDQGTPLQAKRIAAGVVLASLVVLVEPVAGVTVAAALVGAGGWRFASRRDAAQKAAKHTHEK